MSATQFLVWFHLIYFGIVIPLGAIYSRKRILAQSQGASSRLRYYVQISLMLCIFGALSILIAAVIGLRLFPLVWPAWYAILAGLGLYLLSVAVMVPYWRAAIQKQSPVAELFTPKSGPEWVAWLVVSLLAGVSEEITWRGVQVSLLTHLTGQFVLAVIASAISFAIAHAIQGRKSVIVIAIFALCFQLLVWLAQSLWVAMAVHAAYDVTAGLALYHFHRKQTQNRATANLVGQDV